MNNQSKRILAIIPARGGSKRVPNKNIRLVGGKPLIAWTIETTLTSQDLDRIIVSTDDKNIADIARSYGAEVPFLRPAELAQDSVSDLPVYQHTLTWLAKQENYFPEVIVWLRPTAPLRLAEDIHNSVRLLRETSADWVRSVTPVRHHPYWMIRLEDNKLKPFIDGINIRDYYQRQLLPPAYQFNGAVDVAWYETIMDKELLYSGDVRGYVMPDERSVDLDEEIDFTLLEIVLKQERNK